jgi:Amt family ammonium transporter
VHQSSGWAALAYALVLGKRTPPPGAPKAHHKPHNTTLVFLGTVLIWFGWFGFNGGSELAINIRALLATFNTNTAAAAGVLGWTLVDFIRTRGKFSVVGACSGAIAGLVGVTPAAGFVSIWIAALIGFLTAFIIAWLQNLNDWIGIDDGMEVFKLHGIGGMLGSFWTGIFAQQWVSMLDGAVDAPGGLDGNGVQIGHQLAEIVAIAAYSFTMSCIILLILKYIPGLHLRVTSEQELLGYDLDQFFDEQIGDYSLYDEMLRYKEQGTANVQHLHGQRSGSPDGGEGSGDNIEMGSINEMTKSDK